jgi:hypothetical protein
MRANQRKRQGTARAAFAFHFVRSRLNALARGPGSPRALDPTAGRGRAACVDGPMLASGGQDMFWLATQERKKGGQASSGEIFSVKAQTRGDRGRGGQLFTAPRFFFFLLLPWLWVLGIFFPFIRQHSIGECYYHK